ncbi:MAG TPA: TadE/TadG family type IV pilus assembly protein [bacterium]|nr:TadE/TadG family type IV pilus assembly protein [bacterium]
MKSEGGQFALELALIAPMLLILAFLTFEFGRVFGSWLVVTNAAREGARLGITENWCAPATTCTASDTAIEQRVATAAQFITVQTSTTCTVSGNSASAPATSAALPSGQTSCVAVVRWIDSSNNNDHVLQVWAVYKIQTLLPIANAIPFVGRLGYPSSFSVTGLSTVRSFQ